MRFLQLPFYAKAALVFIAGYAFVYALYLAQNIIVPIVYATLIAILLNPLVNWLVRKGCSRVLAISLSVLLVFIITALLLYFIFMQVTMFTDTYPQLKLKFAATADQMIHWVSENFNIHIRKINSWILETENTAYNSSGLMLGRTLLGLGSTFVILLLLPVYLFMILFYKTLLREFINRLFRIEFHAAVAEILLSAKRIVHGYLMGLLLEALVIAVLNSIGLLILGIEYAIILGVTGALLNVIPYIGGAIAIALPMIIAFVTKDSLSYPILILCIYLFIQFVDNHYIIPMVVASKVKINALVSVIVVLAGGALWGIPGMFLSIPLTAILKVIFDHIDSLKPWGFLLGNIVPVGKKPTIPGLHKSISRHKAE
jgi:predicted PurR-regulated permease PerM